MLSLSNVLSTKGRVPYQVQPLHLYEWRIVRDVAYKIYLNYNGETEQNHEEPES